MSNQVQKIDYLTEISNYIFASKYSRYDEKLKRRETWDEAIGRVEKMHLKKYSFLSDGDKNKIKWAFDLVRGKRVVPSMRSIQFGGKAVEAHNARIYNCSVRHIDSLRAFAEIYYLLLCGCGTGIGLSKFFLDRLPDLVNENDKNGIILTYSIRDDIQGWADSIEALLSCYFKNTPYTGRKIVFDYSRIRKKGEPLKTGGGKAPGYKGLKASHLKVKELLDHIIEYKKQSKLKSVDAYDILMHCADSVLSGGSRRSSTSIIFDKNDLDMVNAKGYFDVDKVFGFHFLEDKKIGGKQYKFFEGKIQFEGKKIEVCIDGNDLEKLKKENKISWQYVFPQRARSNNSILLLKDQVTIDEFKKIFDVTRQFGEPGFCFVDNEKQLFNPCLPKWAKILTREGIRKLNDISINDEIWSKEGWVKVIKKWSSGIKKVYEFRTSAGCFYGTEDHKLVSNGQKIKAKDCESIDIFSGEFLTEFTLNPQDVMDGLVIGDGSVHGASNNLVHLNIGENDFDYFNSEISSLITKHRPGLSDYAYEITTTIQANELPKTFDRIIPERYFYGDRAKMAGFLRGIYSANGSICGNRITLKASSFKIIDQVQTMLSAIGIKSYYTTNKATNVKFTNGNYLCKQSYDLNISSDKEKFFKIIGFIQKYKMEKLASLASSSQQHMNHEILETNFISEEEVFDITVDNKSHTFWSQCCDVSNCFEISFAPVTQDGRCGVQFCNLTSINGRLVDSIEKFKECAEASAIIGTLQAGYTDFPYLAHASEEITKDEALLGCSITGMMENPSILLDTKIQKDVSDILKRVNKEWAEKIHISQAARVSCIKPEGTCSIVLSCSSGIHPHHARKYFRRVQNNRIDPVYKFFKKHNPKLCEPSIWSAHDTDDVITFPVEVPDKAMIKSDLTAIEHLKIIKSTQLNWVENGSTENNKKDLKNNVSCTVIVKDDEWDDVIDYLFKNRAHFAAVSFIPHAGDKTYLQAPMEEVKNENDESNWKEMINNFSTVDYSKLVEEDDNTNLLKEAACFGGACEIV